MPYDREDLLERALGAYSEATAGEIASFKGMKAALAIAEPVIEAAALEAEARKERKRAEAAEARAMEAEAACADATLTTELLREAEARVADLSEALTFYRDQWVEGAYDSEFRLPTDALKKDGGRVADAALSPPAQQEDADAKD